MRRKQSETTLERYHLVRQLKMHASAYTECDAVRAKQNAVVAASTGHFRIRHSKHDTIIIGKELCYMKVIIITYHYTHKFSIHGENWSEVHKHSGNTLCISASALCTATISL